ncbi:uncharacterized protein LOC133904144 [Phragmites australis]|uniref:uncharacterized protein LOC133904144 n=1 Tax=Phragmites australis TaxID=29695 RepID=UPI002D790F63|nr:uncharacterized protein LOC133904144 [Phragmites australis]
MTFWRDGGGSGGGSGRDLNGGPPCGQVRVLVVGDSGVGKSSLVHLLLKGPAVARPAQTIGCTVGVKHITYSSQGSSSNSIKGDATDAERNFVELCTRVRSVGARHHGWLQASQGLIPGSHNLASKECQGLPSNFLRTGMEPGGKTPRWELSRWDSIPCPAPNPGPPMKCIRIVKKNFVELWDVSGHERYIRYT